MEFLRKILNFENFGNISTVALQRVFLSLFVSLFFFILVIYVCMYRIVYSY